MWRATERFCSFPKGQTHTYITEKKPEKKSIALLHYVFETKAKSVVGIVRPARRQICSGLVSDGLLKENFVAIHQRRTETRDKRSERQERTVSNQFDFLRGCVKNSSNCRSREISRTFYP